MHKFNLDTEDILANILITQFQLGITPIVTKDIFRSYCEAVQKVARKNGDQVLIHIHYFDAPPEVQKYFVVDRHGNITTHFSELDLIKKFRGYLPLRLLKYLISEEAQNSIHPNI